MKLATWKHVSGLYKGTTSRVIVSDGIKTSKGSFDYDCIVADSLQSPFPVGTELSFFEYELSPLHDPNDILKEML